MSGLLSLGVSPWTSPKLVTAGTSYEGVAALPAEEGVAAVLSIEAVVAALAENGVVSSEPIDDVVSGGAPEIVVTGRAFDKAADFGPAIFGGTGDAVAVWIQDQSLFDVGVLLEIRPWCHRFFGYAIEIPAEFLMGDAIRPSEEVRIQVLGHTEALARVGMEHHLVEIAYYRATDATFGPFGNAPSSVRKKEELDPGWLAFLRARTVAGGISWRV